MSQPSPSPARFSNVSSTSATRRGICSRANWRWRVGGGMDGRYPANDIERFPHYRFIETVARVTGRGAAPCCSCGCGETCKKGIPTAVHGPGIRITEETIPDVTKQPAVMAAAAEAGELPGEAFADGPRSHNSHTADAAPYDGDV